MKSLRGGRLTEACIRPVEKFAGKRTGPPPYTQVLIREWVSGPVQERVFAHQCQTYNDVPLPTLDTYYQQRILPVLLIRLTEQRRHDHHSGLFNQVILHCMTGADCTDGTRRGKAAALYEQYLAHPAVRSPHPYGLRQLARQPD